MKSDQLRLICKLLILSEHPPLIIPLQIAVPDKETTYWYYTTQIPHLTDKHHIIKVSDEHVHL